MDGNWYEGWLPGNFYYLFHLVAWMGPVAALQWAVGPRILRANLRAILLPTLIVGTYLVLTDIVAVAFGVWHFDPGLILAGLAANQPPGMVSFFLAPFGVPIEEWLFFYLTALLCAQSFILFLPENRRHPCRPRAS